MHVESNMKCVGPSRRSLLGQQRCDLLRQGAEQIRGTQIHHVLARDIGRMLKVGHGADAKNAIEYEELNHVRLTDTSR